MYTQIYVYIITLNIYFYRIMKKLTLLILLLPFLAIAQAPTNDSTLISTTAVTLQMKTKGVNASNMQIGFYNPINGKAGQLVTGYQFNTYIGTATAAAIAGAGISYTAGYGLNLTGTQFRVDTANILTKIWAARYQTQASALTSFIQNNTTLQSSSNFHIDGVGAFSNGAKIGWNGTYFGIWKYGDATTNSNGRFLTDGNLVTIQTAPSYNFRLNIGTTNALQINGFDNTIDLKTKVKLRTVDYGTVGNDLLIMQDDTIKKIPGSSYLSASIYQPLFGKKQGYGYTFYNKAFWANNNDFTLQSGLTSTITSTGALRLTGTAAITSYFTINNSQNNNSLRNYELYFTPGSIVATSGIGIGAQSVGFNATAIATYDYNANTLNIVGSTGYVMATISSGFTMAVNDECVLRFYQNGLNITAYIYNITQAKTQSLTITPTAGVFYSPNTSTIGVYYLGGQTDITNIKATTPSSTTPYISFIGDSKTMAYSILNQESSFANLSKSLGVVDVFAGVGDATTNVVGNLPTMLPFFRTGQYVVLCIGRNDVAFGTSPAVWQANYANIVAQIKATGATVIHLLPIPETTANQSALYTYITTTYAGEPMIDPSVGWSNALYLSADAIHPNENGHRFIASLISASGYITARKDAQPFDPVFQYQPAFTSQTGNTFLAAPSGSNGAPTFRAITKADIPGYGTLTASKPVFTDASSNLVSVSVVPSANGGAGTISGILKANGSGVVSAAVSGTDYAPATGGVNYINQGSSAVNQSYNLGTGTGTATYFQAKNTVTAIAGSLSQMGFRFADGTGADFGLKYVANSNATYYWKQYNGSLYDGMTLDNNGNFFVYGNITGNIPSYSSGAFLPTVYSSTNSRFEKVSAAQMKTFLGYYTSGDAITASSFIKTGGTPSQFLMADGSVNSSTYTANPLTTTGDIIYSSSGSTAARLGIGTAGYVLKVASGLPSWVDPNISNDLRYGQLAATNTWGGTNTYSNSTTFNSGSTFNSASTHNQQIVHNSGYGDVYNDSGNTFSSSVAVGTLTANRGITLPDASGTIDLGVKLRLTGSGTGAATTISIAHGLSGVTSASIALVQPINAASAGVSYITTDATNVNIIYTVAPAAGTNNLSYNLSIKP